MRLVCLFFSFSEKFALVWQIWLGEREEGAITHFEVERGGAMKLKFWVVLVLINIAFAAVLPVIGSLVFSPALAAPSAPEVQIRFLEEVLVAETGNDIFVEAWFDQLNPGGQAKAKIQFKIPEGGQVWPVDGCFLIGGECVFYSLLGTKEAVARVAVISPISTTTVVTATAWVEWGGRVVSVVTDTISLVWMDSVYQNYLPRVERAVFPTPPPIPTPTWTPAGTPQSPTPTPPPIPTPTLSP